ncbi:hypothetical protein IV203_016573 [Nitzschia inconspicua]|uniref:Uncharacterized protein n=1 Tax=Nitzschia inconspicua TaxID=303405 RepID=A0A9K3KRN7_9STRA|nr:hypothetical protein IV203_016573 [Nitzschia inconspicua]
MWTNENCLCTRTRQSIMQLQCWSRSSSHSSIGTMHQRDYGREGVEDLTNMFDLMMTEEFMRDHSKCDRNVDSIYVKSWTS